MSFLFPEPQITLYETGFPSDDPLSRKPEGEKLSRLVESISAPMVVALDGGWGSGKTVFLKYWVGQHSIDHQDSTKVVYFDAFAKDFMDQPLSGLVSELNARFALDNDDGEVGGILNRLRTNSAKIALFATRVVGAAASSGLTEVVGSTASAVVNAAGDAVVRTSIEELEAAATRYLELESEQRSAMVVFRETLIALTEPDEQGNPTKRLVFVVDELDRCRPDYALSLLETIKHFFACPGVHFVLGTNLDALSTSVDARYGLGQRSRHYLTKFVDITMNLPENSDQSDERRENALIYFEWATRDGLLSDGFKHDLRNCLKLINRESALSVRETRKFLIHAKLVEHMVQELASNWRLLVGFVVLLRVSKHSDFERFRRGALPMEVLTDLIAADSRMLGPTTELWQRFYGQIEDEWDFSRTLERNTQRMIEIVDSYSFHD